VSEAIVSVARRAAWYAWRIVRWPILVLTLLVAALFCINATDEDLSAQAQSMRRPPANPYADRDNLFVLLAGLEAPGSDSPLAAGRANIAAYRRAVLARPLLGDPPRPDLGQTRASDRLRVTTNMSEWSTLDSSIWERTRSLHASVVDWTSANRILLARYEALHATSGYQEDALRSSFELFYAAPQPLRALYLASIAERVQFGTTAEQLEAVKSLAADVALWGRMLQGEGTLISKMVATAYLHADLILLADMVEDRTVPLDRLESGAASLLVPWRADAWKIGKVYRTEFRRFAAVLGEMSADPDRFLTGIGESPGWIERRWSHVGRVFYKPDATLNLQAQIMEHLGAVSDADPAHYSENARAYGAWFADLRTRRFPAILYNPIGKILIEIGGMPYLDYCLRTFDVAAFQRLVVLAYQLRAQAVAPEDVPAFMAAHPEWSTHPVDRVPFRWDAATSEVRVIQRGKGRPGRRFGIRVAVNTPS
jgi:hypothetical protein